MAVTIVNGVWNNPDQAGGGNQLKLRHDFNGDANSLLTGLTAESGQSWEVHNAGTGAEPRVVSNEYTHTATTGGAAAYLGAIVESGVNVNYIEADFRFGASGSANAQSAALVIGQESVASAMGSGVANWPVHCVFTNTYYQLGIYNGPSLVVVGTVLYDVPFTTEDQHVEIVLNKSRSEAYVRGPDGNITRFTHSVMGTMNPTHATWEVYQADAANDKDVFFKRIQADTQPLTIQSGAPTKAQSLMGDALALSQKLSGITARTTDFSLNTSTTQTDVVTTAIPGRNLEVGSTFRVNLRGTIRASAASVTCTFRIYIGTNAAAETFVWTSGAAVGPVGFDLDIYATVRSLGAAGTFVADGAGVVQATSTTINHIARSGSGTAVVDTTLPDRTVKVTAQWSASNASNALVVPVAVISQVV